MTEGHVLRVEVEGRLRRLAVTPGPADLLVVGVDRLGHVGVGHEADVRLVDPHPERGGGYDDVERPGLEAVVHVVAAWRGSLMVGGGAHAGLGDPLRQLLGPPAVATLTMAVPSLPRAAASVTTASSCPRSCGLLDGQRDKLGRSKPATTIAGSTRPRRF